MLGEKRGVCLRVWGSFARDTGKWTDGGRPENRSWVKLPRSWVKLPGLRQTNLGRLSCRLCYGNRR